MEPRSRALQHPRSNHYANMTPLPPTPIGKVPYCIHSHGAHVIFLIFHNSPLLKDKSTIWRLNVKHTNIRSSDGANIVIRVSNMYLQCFSTQGPNPWITFSPQQKGAMVGSLWGSTIEWTVSAVWFKAMHSTNKRIWEIDKLKIAYGIFQLPQLVILNLWTTICSYHWATKMRYNKKGPQEAENYFNCTVQGFSLVLHKPCASRELLYMSSAYHRHVTPNYSLIVLPPPGTCPLALGGSTHLQVHGSAQYGSTNTFYCDFGYTVLCCVQCTRVVCNWKCHKFQSSYFSNYCLLCNTLQWISFHFHTESHPGPWRFCLNQGLCVGWMQFYSVPGYWQLPAPMCATGKRWCMCVLVCTCVCCVCVGLHIHVCVLVSIHVCARMCVCVRVLWTGVCVSLCVYVCLHVHVYVCVVYVCMCVYMCTCIKCRLVKVAW